MRILEMIEVERVSGGAAGAKWVSLLALGLNAYLLYWIASNYHAKPKPQEDMCSLMPPQNVTLPVSDPVPVTTPVLLPESVPYATAQNI